MIYLLGAVSEGKAIFILNSSKKVAYILLHIENLCDLGSTAFAVASYPCFCTRLDFLCFFNSNIYCTWLFVVPSVQSSYCCYELFQVLMKIFSSNKMSSDKSSKPNYTWKYFSFYVINNQNISVFNTTCFDSCPVRMIYSTHDEFSQDTLLPGATWKEVFTLLYHRLGQ